MNNPLEQFSPLLDAAGMASFLQRQLPECSAGDWRVTGCEIQHPRYKSYIRNRDRACLSLVYHVQGRQTASAKNDTRIFYVRAYLGDRSRQVFEVMRTAAGADSHGSLLHFPALGMVGWRFPNDPAMPWLAELVDIKRAEALLPRGDDGQSSGCNRLLSIEIVNYRPEIRCTARYRFAAGSAREHCVYAKSHADGKGRRIYGNLRALHEQAHAVDAFVMPAALGYDMQRHALWLQGLHGTPLKSSLFHGGDALPVALAKALGRFHDCAIPELPVLGPAQHLREWQKKAGKLMHAYPALGAAICGLLSALGGDCPEKYPLGLLHGDFHVEQICLLPSGRLALFDYDELALGDPLQDLANFCADLYSQWLAETAMYPLIEAFTDKFYTAYSRFTPRGADAARFYWHLRGQLLTRAYRAHIQQRPETAQTVARLICLALRPVPGQFNHRNWIATR